MTKTTQTIAPQLGKTTTGSVGQTPRERLRGCLNKRYNYAEPTRYILLLGQRLKGKPGFFCINTQGRY